MLPSLSRVAPTGTFLAVLVAYFTYRSNLKQRTEADNRKAWWDRVQWATNTALSDDAKQSMTGLRALSVMQDSHPSVRPDEELLLAISSEILTMGVELRYRRSPEANYTENDEGGSHGQSS